MRKATTYSRQVDRSVRLMWHNLCATCGIQRINAAFVTSLPSIDWRADSLVALPAGF